MLKYSKITLWDRSHLGKQVCFLDNWFSSGLDQNLKIRTASAIFWIYLGMLRDYGLKNIFFRNKSFLFFKIDDWHFQNLFEIKFRETSLFSAHSDNCYFQFFYRLCDWVEILWGFMKFFFKQMLKVSALYLENKKVLFLKKYFSSRCRYHNKKSFVYWPNFQWSEPQKFG